MEPYLQTFDSLPCAEDVREWVNKNHHKFGFFDEYPRGGGLWLLTRAMAKCKYANELAEDVKKIDDYWHQKGEMPLLGSKAS